MDLKVNYELLLWLLQNYNSI